MSPTRLAHPLAVPLALLVLSVASTSVALPIAHWRFDESPGATVAATSIGAVDGTLGGGAAFVAGGVSGNAVEFSRATGDYVTMGDAFGLSGPFSVAAWVKTAPDDRSIDTIVLGRHDGGSINRDFVGLNTSAGYGQLDKAYFYPSPSVGQEATSTTTVNDGGWHLVVGVFDVGGMARIFVDGGPVEATSSGLSIGSNTAEFLVGAVWFGGAPTARYDGLIDEVQIYDSALTQGDIDFLFANPGSVVPEPAPAALLALAALALGLARRGART